MTGLIEVIGRHRVIVALGLAVLIGTMLAGAAQLRVDNSLEAWFVDDDPALVSYLQFQQQFGHEELVVTILRGPGPGLDAGRLSRLSLLGAELANVDGVTRVQTLATLQPATILPPVDSTDVAATRAAVAGSRTAATLVGKDGRSLVVQTLLDASVADEDGRPWLLDTLFSLVDSSLDGDSEGEGETAHHGGIGVLHDALNRATLEQGSRYILASYVVIAVVLFLLLRSWPWFVLAIGVVAVADLCLFGIMGLADKPLNMVSMALPALVMILGVANVVHLRMAGAALGVVAVPCALNAMTTAGGFLSLGSASMAITRDYGLLAAIGVLLAFALSIIGVALFRPWLRPTETTPSTRLADLVAAAMVFSLRHRLVVVPGTIMLLVLALVGVRRLEVDTFSMDFLPQEHVYRSDSAAIEAALGAYIPLELTIATPDPGGWRQPTVLGAVAAAQAQLEDDPEIGQTFSVADVIADVITRLNGSSIDGRIDWDIVGPRDVALALDWMRFAGGPAALSHLVAEDDRTLRLTTSTRMGSAADLTRIAGGVLTTVRATLGTQAHVALSGYLPLYSEMITHTLTDQINSFALAFAVVFGIVAVVLRSWRLTVAAILPNILPPLMVLGVMGLAGLRLDVATVTIAAAILGIVVDDTLHILYRLRQSLATTVDLEAAVQATARDTGVAIVCTSLVFCAGFAVIATAGVRSVALVGLLTAVGVASALLTDLLILPALLTWLFPDEESR